MRLLVIISSAILLLPIILFLALKGIIYYQSKQALDDFIKRSSAFASITYDDVSASFDGTLSIKNIDIVPKIAGERFNAGAIKVHTPGFSFLLQGKSAFENNTLPEKFGISIEKMRPQVNLSDILKAHKQPNKIANPILSCFYQPEDITKIIPLDNLKWDLYLGYQFNTAERSAILSSRLTLPNFISFDIDVDIKNIKPKLSSLTQWVQQKPGILPTTIRYQDLSVTNQLIEQCAEANQQSPADTIEQLVSADSAEYMKLWGFYPGDEIREGFKNFLTNPPHEIVLAIHPTRKIDSHTLKLYKIQDIIKLLHLKITVNDTVINNLAFTLPSSQQAYFPDIKQLTQKLSQPTATTEASTTKAKSPSPKKSNAVKNLPLKPRYKPRYRRIKLANAKQYVGKKTRIYFIDQTNYRQGRIEQVTDKEIIILRKYSGGYTTSEASLKRIKKIEIYLKKPPR